MGKLKHDGLAIPGRVVLAHEPPFDLGSARVDPSTLQIAAGERHETLEPRVMQVLVALARMAGSIVTREELIDRCWEGRIVSDDAVNRVLSRLRQIGAGIGGETFKIETITKVGYRLIETAPAVARQPAGGHPETQVPTGRLSRRVLVGGGLAAAGIAVAGVALIRAPHRPAPEAVDLYRRGDLAQRVGTASQTRQAISYLEEAVRVDPNYGAAWGALALSYTHTLDGFSEAQMDSLAGRIRSAAARSMALDGENADAEVALASITPVFRNWAKNEARLRALTLRFPNHWLGHGRLAAVLRQEGRLDEAILHQQRLIDIDPMVPPAYGFAALALSSAGRIQEADDMLKRALDRWPAHPMLWWVKYRHLLFTGRAQSAAAYVMDPESLPSGVDPAEVQQAVATAMAVARRDPVSIEAAVQTEVRNSLVDVRAMGPAAPMFALLGRLDLTFAALERYLLNHGSFGKPAPIGPMTRRSTDILFELPMAAARADPRFAPLMNRVGLAGFWRTSGTEPDFRRPGQLR